MSKKYKQVRFKMSQEWLENNPKNANKRGFVVGETKNGHSYKVIFDGNKSENTYYKGFIQTDDSLIETTNDLEIKEMTNEENKEKTLSTLEDIQNSLNKINILGLNRHATILLIRDYVGASKITNKQIELILDCLPKIKSHYEAK